MKTLANKILKLALADSYLFTSEENIRYICGFRGDSSQLLITPEKNFFFTDSRYEIQSKKEISECEIIITSAANRNTEISKHIFGNTLGVEKNNISIKEFESFKKVYNNVNQYIDVSAVLLDLRTVKTDIEIELIKKAAAANENALENTLSYIKEGASEYEIKAKLIYEINKQGMELAFEPIVASGSNSAMPHAKCTSKKINRGDLLTIDFGSKYFSYCSDMTRTFVIGSIDEKQKNIYDIVKNAQKCALDNAEIGNDLCSVDKSARDYINKHGYEKCFSHSTGHGVGINIHELPVINAVSKGIIEKNMVFTIEPGIYLENEFGVRIEDMIIGGIGNIYTFSKELIIL